MVPNANTAAVWIAAAGLAACAAAATPGVAGAFPVPQGEWNPKTYVCHSTSVPIEVDGWLGDLAWRSAPWSDEFVDIVGPGRPAPRFRTRVKMSWDGDYFYVAARMEEPHVWATLTKRDAVIYHDNDFEVFIDPDGDTHEYYELELNALNTEWDLFLVRPYRDGGPAVHAWDLAGLRTAVQVDGTLNDPKDRDTAWSVEIAFPWKTLGEAAHRAAPPGAGDAWRVNFSRVEWRTHVENGVYVKDTDPAGRPLPEDNWVWSPQGLVNMHYPEMWGFVVFAGRSQGGEAPEIPPPALAGDERIKWELRLIYYRQKESMETLGFFEGDPLNLGLKRHDLGGYSWPPTLWVTPRLFEASYTGPDGRHHIISQDGRTWTE